MEIILGKTAGFCYGVKRAVEGAEETIKQNSKDVYCLGEIVHNNEVIKDLEEKGIRFVENFSDVNGTTIIRAHGIAKEVYDELKKRKINIKDYTCPNVLKIHEIAEEYAQKGYYIFLTGSKKHPENIGTISFCGNNYSIIENKENVESAIKDFNKTKIKKLLLISQTTYSIEKFNQIQESIEKQLDIDIELVVKNTICASTKIRQNETERISKQVDFMIIIGGKNSSNTKKLFEIASKFCKKSVCIENARELEIEKIKDYKKIGIMSGASTPKTSIDKVINKLYL